MIVHHDRMCAQNTCTHGHIKTQIWLQLPRNKKNKQRVQKKRDIKMRRTRTYERELSKMCSRKIVNRFGEIVNYRQNLWFLIEIVRNVLSRTHFCERILNNTSIWHRVLHSQHSYNSCIYWIYQSVATFTIEPAARMFFPVLNVLFVLCV